MRILLRRIAQRAAPGVNVRLPAPIRVQRKRVAQADELEHAVELAARSAGADGRILILLDADRDCPGQLAPELLRRAHAARSDRMIRIVLARTEYEAWFLAAADSIAGRCDIHADAAAPDDPEAIRGAKEWLRQRMPRGKPYRPTLHQADLTKFFDLDAARSAPSFDKLWRDVSDLLREAPRGGQW